ncbi:DUF547 domain-containing protein [Algibacter sp. R77976]|uniref:DUF547 domain-containing protein n=1 Tax=Algibacter sp. R77976 TaxID=3093873 RepID=UPI0037CBF64C
MKYLKLIALFFVIASCSSTKHISETTSKSPSVAVKTKDSIAENTKPIEEAIAEPIAIAVSKDSVSTKSEPKIENEISKSFNHNAWTALLKRHVSNQGNVNYKGFKTDRKALLSYISSLSDNMPNDAWVKEEKLAYWINAYNAMTIDLILRHYPLKSIKDIKDPWDQRFWKLGEKWYNLNEIEHDILRKMDEPRIHFGIVCASFSCPKLLNEAFTAKDLDQQLTGATTGFLNDSKRNEISENSVNLSKIFQWFSKDFKQNGSLIEFINTYSSVDISAKAKKTFKDYNWALNE